MVDYFSPEDFSMLVDFQEIYPWFLRQGEGWPVSLSDFAADAAGAWLAGEYGDTFKEVIAVEAIGGSGLLAALVAGALGLDLSNETLTPEEIRVRILEFGEDRLDQLKQAGAAG